MYEVMVKGEFSSAHSLRDYDGDCENIHGHNWKVEITFLRKDLDKIGLTVDFRKLKYILNEVIEKLDHKYLNNIDPFKDINPSSENIAKFIFYQIKDMVKDANLKSVRVWESEDSAASYYE